jgi:hypothetical protein
MRVEAPRGLDQPDARNLQKVLIVLAAMREPASQRFRQPEMGRDDFVEDPFAFGRICSLGLDEEVLGMFGEFFARGMGSRNHGSPEDRHERDTLRYSLRAWRAAWPPLDVSTGVTPEATSETIQGAKKSLRNAVA